MEFVLISYPYIFTNIPVFYRKKKSHISLFYPFIFIYTHIYFIGNIYICIPIFYPYRLSIFFPIPAMDSHPEIFTFPWNRTIAGKNRIFWISDYNSSRSEAPHNSLICSVHVKSTKYSIDTHSAGVQLEKAISRIFCIFVSVFYLYSSVAFQVMFSGGREGIKELRRDSEEFRNVELHTCRRSWKSCSGLGQDTTFHLYLNSRTSTEFLGRAPCVSLPVPHFPSCRIFWG